MNVTGLLLIAYIFFCY